MNNELSKAIMVRSRLKNKFPKLKTIETRNHRNQKPETIETRNHRNQKP